jgi:hypothetical protein
VAQNRCAEYVSPGSSLSCGRGGRRATVLLGSLGYFAILGASLAGYAGVGPWVVAIAAIALASFSRAEHGLSYERGRELGLYGIIDSAMIRSVFNAVLASATTYSFGWLIRSI